MLIHPSFSELKLSVSDQASHPNWVTLSTDEIRRARYILSRECLASDDPFGESDYLNINFPYRVGDVANNAREVLLNSDAYHSPCTKIDFWLRTDTDEWPSGVAEFRPVFEQFIEADRILYNQPNTIWYFNVDIQNVKAGYIQRPENAYGTTELFHIDGGMGNYVNFKRMLENLNSEGELIYPKHREPILVRSLPRSFTAVFTDPPDPRLQTEFKNVKTGLFNWDVGHFVGEQHRSPEAPVDCRRLFLRGVARAVV